MTWISENTLGGALAAAGVPFAPIRRTGWLWPPPPTPDLSSIPPQEAVMLRYRRALDTWLSEDLVGEAVAALIELAGEIGTPDAIVTDPFLTAAALAAEALSVPLAVCGWVAQKELNEDFLFPVQRELGAESQQRISRSAGALRLAGRQHRAGTDALDPQPALARQLLQRVVVRGGRGESAAANVVRRRQARRLTVRLTVRRRLRRSG